MDPVQALEAAFAHTSQIISNITPDQMGNSTPCSEWDVAALLGHTTGVVGAVGGAVGGPAPDKDASFEQAAAGAIEGWRSFDLSSSIDFPMPDTPGQAVAAIQLMDVCGHAWDLAKATGQNAEFAPDLCEAAMAASQMVITDELREGRFDSAVDAPNASPTDQLAAFMGRQV